MMWHSVLWQTDRQGNSQEPTASLAISKTHTHTEAWWGTGCACAQTHIILLVDANQVFFKAFTVSQQQHVAANKKPVKVLK